MLKATDRAWKATGPFRRYTSLSDAGIDVGMLRILNPNANAMIKKWRDKFTKLMLPSFRVPMLVRGETGHVVNVDEAIEGVSECFRRTARVKKAPLRIGINLSRQHGSDTIIAMRGGAVLALVDLCKSRGQNTEIEICYGNGLSRGKEWECHVRIELHGANSDLMSKVCLSENLISIVGERIIERQLSPNHAWFGAYRFYEFESDPKSYPAEYDFVLDRIETSYASVEEKRIIERLQKLKLM